MKLLTFSVDGTVSWGAVKGDGVVDLGKRFGERAPTLRAALAGNHLHEAEGMVEANDADHALGDIVYLPVVPNPDKILCVGLNYEPHRLEGGHAKTEHPTIFARFASSQTAHEQPLLSPRESDKLDYEGEIAIVIGKGTAASRRTRPSTTSPATPATMKAACATGSATARSSFPARISRRPAPSAPGW